MGELKYLTGGQNKNKNLFWNRIFVQDVKLDHHIHWRQPLGSQSQPVSCVTKSNSTLLAGISGQRGKSMHLSGAQQSGIYRVVQKNVPVRFLGTRFTNAISCFGPGPQEPYL
jgi:hypothetical protein